MKYIANRKDPPDPCQRKYYAALHELVNSTHHKGVVGVSIDSEL